MRPTEVYVCGLIEGRQIANLLLWVYTTLSDDESDAFVLGALGGCAEGEVARRMHISTRRAHYLIARAKRKIRAGLLEHPDIARLVAGR